MLGTAVQKRYLDEIPSIQTIAAGTTPLELLARTGWFFLADVFRVLDPDDSGQYKLAFKQMDKLNANGADVHGITGRIKLGGRVAILMERFSVWYRNNPLFHLQEPDASFTDFMNGAQGTFRLSSICNRFGAHLPLSYLSLKRIADRTRYSHRAVGIYKYDSAYLVSMPHFAIWLRTYLADLN